MHTFPERARPSMNQVLSHTWFGEEKSRKHKLLSPTQVDTLVGFARQLRLDVQIMLNIASHIPTDKLQDFAHFVGMARNRGSTNEENLSRILEQAGFDHDDVQQAVQCFTRTGPVEFSRSVKELLLAQQSRMFGP